MKFLCDNCKAKYLIADDKVAGKTVRMKCRKCGHQIEVRAAVTESSVSASLSAEGAVAARPGLATSLAAHKPRPTNTARGSESAAPPPSSALAGAFQRQIDDSPSGAPAALTGSAAGHAGQTGSVEVSVTDEWYVAINGVPVGPVRISELRRKAAAGIVTDDSLCWQEGLEEWRPIRSIAELAAIVRDAAQQNRPSLVNPDPSERRSVPPNTARHAPTPPPGTGHAPMRPNASTAPAAPRISEPPRPFSSGAPRSNVVPLHGSNSPQAPRVSTLEANSIAAVAFASTPQTAPMQQPFLSSPPHAVMAPFAQPLPAAAPDPFAFAPPMTPPFAAAAPHATVVADVAAPAASFASSGSSASLVAPLPAVAAAAATSGRPLWFYLAAIFMLGFGGMLSFFLFNKPQTQTVVREVAVPGPPTAAPTDPKDDSVPLLPASSEPIVTSAGTVKAPASGTKSAASSIAAAPSSTMKGLDLKGLGSSSGGGPDVSSNGPSGAAGGGLDSAGVERVVRERGPATRRKCWDTASPDKSSVNVTVSVNVAANGAVSNATASGNDPVVAKCIENQVRLWQFPAPGAPTTVNVPFHFVRQ